MINLIEVVWVLEMERVMGFEPTTSCLGSKHSSAELHPHVKSLTEDIYRPFSFENLYKQLDNWWHGLRQSWQPLV